MSSVKPNLADRNIIHGGEYQERLTTEQAEVLKMEKRLTEDDVTDKEASNILSVLIPKYIRRLKDREGKKDVSQALAARFSKIERPRIIYKARMRHFGLIYKIRIDNEQYRTVLAEDFEEGIRVAKERTHQIKRELLGALFVDINLELDEEDITWGDDISNRKETAEKMRGRYGI